MKLPNDLIKSTDYDKAKDRIIHEFECVNGKVVQHYVLGGEHELTTQEIIDCLNALATIDCDLQTAYAYIKGQEEKIFDLEAKLAERKEFCISQTQSLLDINNDLIEENNELKQQLFESGLKTLEEIKLSEQRKKMLEDLSTKNWELEQQLAEKEDKLKSCKESQLVWKNRAVAYKYLILGLNELLPNKPEKELPLNKIVDDVKLLFAEKEKEIEYLNKQARKFNNEAQKYFEDAYCNDSIYQDKIEFAIAELDKLRQLFIYNYNSEIEYIDPYDNNCCLNLTTTIYNTTIDIFNNQIEELKKEMK